MPKRPRKPIRVFVLVAATACLGLAMCHFSKKPEDPANSAASGSVQPAAASGSGSGSAQVEQQAKPKPKPQQPYFPATKSAGPFR